MLGKNLQILSRSFENKGKKEEGFNGKQPPSESTSSKDLNSIANNLCLIITTKPVSSRDLLESIENNLRYASYESFKNRAYYPKNKNYRDLVFLTMKKQGFHLKKANKNSVKVFHKKGGFKLNLKDIDQSEERYKDKLKFKKKAAILPEPRFVKKLAKEAYDTIVKIRPKDVSKAIASMVHSLWFDYAIDRNIYLASMLYTELRENYLPYFKKEFGLDEIKYFASDDRDKKLAKYVQKVIDDSSKQTNIVGTVKNWYNELTIRGVCDRIILMGECLGIPEKKLENLAYKLASETNLEFEFE